MSGRGAKSKGRWYRAALVWGGGGALAVLAVAMLTPRPAPEPPRSQVIEALPPPPPLPSPEPVSLPAPVQAVEELALPPPPQVEPPAWRRFAAVAPAADGRPRIAVVVDDLGLDGPRTARAMALAPAVTLSFMSYANGSRTEAVEARAAGHELLVHVPMEPRDPRQDMGPNGLAAGLGPEEVLRRLRWDLDRLDAYVGINNHMGSKFTADATAMELVIAELKARGLLFLDSRTTGDSRGALVAQRDAVPFAERDVFLDDDMSAPAIAAQLRELEAWARLHGTAVGIGHPHDETLTALAVWIGTLPEKGLVLVPLTAVVEARGGAVAHAEGVAARDLARQR